MTFHLLHTSIPGFNHYFKSFKNTLSICFSARWSTFVLVFFFVFLIGSISTGTLNHAYPIVLEPRFAHPHLSLAGWVGWLAGRSVDTQHSMSRVYRPLSDATVNGHGVQVSCSPPKLKWKNDMYTYIYFYACLF